MPEKQEGILERLGGENVLFPPAALMTIEQYGQYWPEPYSEIFYGNIKAIVESGFFQIIAEELEEEIDIRINVWCFYGGGYRSILDVTEMELESVMEMHQYFLSTN